MSSTGLRRRSFTGRANQVILQTASHTEACKFDGVVAELGNTSGSVACVQPESCLVMGLNPVHTLKMTLFEFALSFQPSKPQLNHVHKLSTASFSVAFRSVQDKARQATNLACQLNTL